MKTEATKYFHHGFVLTEGELRRIVTIAEDQLNKLPGVSIDSSFEMKFRNGALAVTGALDEVLSQENHGSSRLTQLKFRAHDVQTHSSVSTEFVDVEHAEPNSKALSFAVSGDSRDWVFVTSSLLEERVQKIRRLPLKEYLGFNASSVLTIYMVAILLGVLIGMVLYIKRQDARFGLNENTPSRTIQEPEIRPFSEDYEAALRSKGVKDPVEAMILREQVDEKRRSDMLAWREQNLRLPPRDAEQSNHAPSLFWTIAIPAAIFPIALLIFNGFITLYYPAYNFCWGDYLESFRKKEAIRRFILVVVFIGVLVSFVGGILANLIHFAR